MAIVYKDETNPESSWKREFIITDRDFENLRKLVNFYTGIHLSSAKRELIYSRLASRLRKNNLTKFSDYCKLLQEDTQGEEITHFRNAITTNLTSFFREPHHFDFFKKTALPEIKAANRDINRLRIWSAGCSTGEEPYSIAITLKESNLFNSNYDVKILATDIDSTVIESAQNGTYYSEKLDTLSARQKKVYFSAKRQNEDGQVQISSEISQFVTFKQLNLMHEWPMKGPFDVIFCRNVLIYFSKPTQRVLIERFANILSDNGYLFIGHSESLFKISDRFKLMGQTMYKKVR